MGGHGGLNILPQKRWNVYNFDNREKVKKDEEAAAREEQLKREDSRRRDAEFRIQILRQARGLEPNENPNPNPNPATPAAAAPSASDSRHINLFDGLRDFSSLAGVEIIAAPDGGDRNGKRFKREGAEGGESRKKQRTEEAPKISPEDEKYKLGYGLAGRGVKDPWYVTKPPSTLAAGDIDGRGSSASADASMNKKGGKKTVEELREERMRREKQEKERERALVASIAAKNGVNRGFSRSRLGYRS